MLARGLARGLALVLAAASPLRAQQAAVWRDSLVRVTLDSASGRTVIGRIRGADSLALRLSAMAREAGPALATALDLRASDSLTRDSVAITLAWARVSRIEVRRPPGVAPVAPVAPETRDSVVVCTETVEGFFETRSRRTRFQLIGGAVGLVAAIIVVNNLPPLAPSNSFFDPVPTIERYIGGPMLGASAGALAGHVLAKATSPSRPAAACSLRPRAGFPTALDDGWMIVPDARAQLLRGGGRDE